MRYEFFDNLPKTNAGLDHGVIAASACVLLASIGARPRRETVATRIAPRLATRADRT